MQDEDWMMLALEEAAIAASLGEVPIGAVLVDATGQLLARGHNRTIIDCDPTAHAEVVVMRKAAQRVGNYRLSQMGLYVTVEPCVMCVGAMVQARIRKIVFGAYNSRGGACGTAFDLTRNRELNHHIHEVKGGVLEIACREQMQQFFEQKRA